MPAMTSPEISSARGIVRRGSRISPARIRASSSPANAKQICAKKMIVSKFENDGANDVAGIGVADPSASNATVPMNTTTSEAPMSGERLFHASAVLAAPDGVDLDAVQRELEQLANELMVDLNFGRPS